MTPIKRLDSIAVQTAIEEAAAAACKRLDETFPGHDKGGITSNFQGQLVSIMAEMLNGQAQGRRDCLPVLAVDELQVARFSPQGSAFLPMRYGEMQWKEEDGRQRPIGKLPYALDPDRKVWSELPNIGDAWPSASAAASSVLDWAESQRLTVEELRSLEIIVMPVRHVGEVGYAIDLPAFNAA